MTYCLIPGVELNIPEDHIYEDLQADNVPVLNAFRLQDGHTAAPSTHVLVQLEEEEAQRHSKTELHPNEEPHEHPELTQAILPTHSWAQREDTEESSVLDPSEEELQGEKVSTRTQRQEPANNTAVIPPGHDTADDYDDSDMFLEDKKDEEDTATMGQHFFPSFTPLFPPSPPIGHSRPQLLFQEPAHSHRPALLRPQHNGFQPVNFGTAKFLPAPAAAENTGTTNNLLGSGNFGVIRGGTFYSEDEQSEINEYGSGESHHVYSPFYHNNNGHGRPAFYGNGGASNPRPQHHRGNDFFANFRDFAEINTPAKQSYSEFYVVYVNKNATGHEDSEPKRFVLGEKKPKNIIEQLSLLDQEDKAHVEPKTNSLLTVSNNDKLTKKSAISAGKLKLAQMKQEKINKEKNKKMSSVGTAAQKDLHEPLLALS
ncbi:uncharacterized protein [Anabrus simplex]|uniref:uncharacterized protein n=1 Tax=Anabrus simplex TaxID=316456 RepID=UPI0035A3790C